MQYVYPDYYPKFHCLAQRCRHSCCIGWEIEYLQENRTRCSVRFADHPDFAVFGKIRKFLFDG